MTKKLLLVFGLFALLLILVNSLRLARERMGPQLVAAAAASETATPLFMQVCVGGTDWQDCQFAYYRYDGNDFTFVRDAAPEEAYQQIRLSEANWRSGGSAEDAYTVFAMYGNLGYQYPKAWEDYARLASELTGVNCNLPGCFASYYDHVMRVWELRRGDERLGAALVALYLNAQLAAQEAGFDASRRYREQELAVIRSAGERDPFVCAHLSDTVQIVAVLGSLLGDAEASRWAIHAGDALSTCRPCPGGVVHYDPFAAVAFYSAARDTTGGFLASRKSANALIETVATPVDQLDPCVAATAERYAGQVDNDEAIHMAAMVYLGIGDTPGQINATLEAAAIVAETYGLVPQAALLRHHINTRYAEQMLREMTTPPSAPEPAPERPIWGDGIVPTPFYPEQGATPAHGIPI